MSIRLVFVTDIHHGHDHLTKKGSAALALLAELRRVVAEVRADALIDLGDRISDVDRPTDLRREREVADAFRAMPGPCHHICGNHDLVHLSVADNEHALGQSLAPLAIDLGEWRLVLWRADAELHGPGGFRLAEPDVQWLTGVVRSADRPLVVTSHIPVSGHAQTGNYYFHQQSPVLDLCRRRASPDHAAPGARAGRVGRRARALEHGHARGRHSPRHAASIAWQAHGRDPVSFSMPVAAAARRWIAPLPPFHLGRPRRAPTIETGPRA